MKKTFQIIGLISLTCFSFFVTEKTAVVVSDMDEIMIEIKQHSREFNTKSMDATIENNTIIPGIRGKNVNINKSYKSMKNYGYYSNNLYVYDYKNPNISLENNKDKYIIKGNSKKRMISLIFKFSNNDDISDVLSILNNYNIKSTFFVDSNWFLNNNNLIQSIIKNNHNIGILLDDYSDPNFEWMDMVIKKVNKQSIGFCYNEKENQNNLKECKLRNNYTIKPRVINENSPLLDIKSKLNVGELLSFTVNSQLKKELSTMIIYIKSKGFTITNLQEHILE